MKQLKNIGIKILHSMTRFSNFLEYILEQRILTKLLNMIWLLINIWLFWTGRPYSSGFSMACTVAILIGTTYIGALVIMFAAPLIPRLLTFVLDPFVRLDTYINTHNNTNNKEFKTKKQHIDKPQKTASDIDTLIKQYSGVTPWLKH